MGGVACCKHRRDFQSPTGDLALPEIDSKKKADPIVKFEM